MPSDSDLPTQAGVRFDPQVARLALYRSLAPFSPAPSYAEAREIIKRRQQVGYDAVERFVCRLALTVQVEALAELRGDANRIDLPELWALVREGQDWLDRQGRSPDQTDVKPRVKPGVGRTRKEHALFILDAALDGRKAESWGQIDTWIETAAEHRGMPGGVRKGESVRKRARDLLRDRFEVDPQPAEFAAALREHEHEIRAL